MTAVTMTDLSPATPPRFAALRGGDPDAAAEAARAHLATSKETLLGSLRSHKLG